MSREDIRFYCGLTHGYWNYHRVDAGPLACISPIVGCGKGQFRATSVYVPDGTLVFQDSGAYGDSLLSRIGMRPSFEEALNRQEKHAEQYNYSDRIEYRASYDLLVDHRFATVEGSSRRKIVRCSDAAGEEAVYITVEAAKFLNDHRNGYACALNVQGATPEQYLRCTKQVVPLLRDGDILGLGGWCIVGRMPSMMSDFLRVLALIMPFIAREKVPRVHVYGCIYTPALAACLALCNYYGISMSVDSAFPSFGPRIGKWGYGSWRKKRYTRPKVLPSCFVQTCPPNSQCLGLSCIRHVRATRDWLAHFSDREYTLYKMYYKNLDQYRYGKVIDLDFDLDNISDYVEYDELWV